MRGFFLLSFIFLVASLWAQQGIYIRPHLERKWHTTNGTPYSFTTAQNYTVTGTPYRFWAAGGFDIGLSVGYKGPWWFAELSYGALDGALVGTKLRYTEYSAITGQYFIQDYSQYLGSGSYSRYSLQSGLRLKKSNEAMDNLARVEYWVFGSIDVWRRPPTTPGQTDGVSWYTSPTDSMSYGVKALDGNRVGLFGTLGIMLKAFNKKGHSILNVSVRYSAALRQYQQMSVSLMSWINYTDGTVYNTILDSNGSGLYLQFSKDIYLNNIFKNKRKKELVPDYGAPE